MDSKLVGEALLGVLFTLSCSAVVYYLRWVVIEKHLNKKG